MICYIKIYFRTDFVFFREFVVSWLVWRVNRRRIEVCFSPDVILLAQNTNFLTHPLYLTLSCAHPSNFSPQPTHSPSLLLSHPPTHPLTHLPSHSLPHLPSHSATISLSPAPTHILDHTPHLLSYLPTVSPLLTNTCHLTIVTPTHQHSHSPTCFLVKFMPGRARRQVED